MSNSIKLSDTQKEVISRMKGGYVLYQRKGSFAKGAWHLHKNLRGGRIHSIDLLKSTCEKLLRLKIIEWWVSNDGEGNRRFQLTALGKSLVKANTTTLRNSQTANVLTPIQKKVIMGMRKYAALTKPIRIDVFQIKIAVWNNGSNKLNRSAGSFMKRLVDKKLVVAKYPNAYNWNLSNFDNVYWELTDWGKNINLAESKR